MATLARLDVKLGLDSATFKKGVQNANRSLKNLGRQMKAVANTAARGLTIGATAATAALTAMYQSQSKLIDNTAKTADKLGITTQALSELRYAAELTGVSSGTLDTALQRMTRRLSDAANGGGPAAKALEELGLNAEALANQSPDRALDDIADAMQGVGTQSDRVRLAFALFDSQGVDLVNTLAGGSEGLAHMRNEAQDLGIVMSREMAKSVEMANDNLARSSTVAASFGQLLTGYVSVAVADVTGRLVNMAKEQGGVGDSAGNMAIRIVEALGWVGTALYDVRIGYQVIKVGLIQVSQAVVGAFEWMVEQVVKAINQMQYRFKDAIWHMGDAIKKVPGLRTLSAEMREYGSSVSYLQRPDFGSDGLGQKVSDELAALDDLVVGRQKYADAVTDITESMRTKITEIEQAGQLAVAEERAKNNNNIVSTTQTTLALVEQCHTDAESLRLNNHATFIETLQAMSAEELDAYIEGIQERMSHTQAFVGAMDGLLSNLISNGEDQVKAEREKFKEMNTLQKTQFLLTRANMFAEAVMSAQLGAAKALAQGGFFGGPVMAGIILGMGMLNAGAIAAQTFSVAGARERGGPVESGKAYLVGERGPEILQMGNQSGNVIPNNQLGGTTNNVSVQVNAHDARGFDDLLTERSDLLVALVEDALASQGRMIA